MKTKIFNLIVGLLLITSFSVFAQETKTEKFKVYGSCGMCKTRIEKAAKSVEGVTSADWDQETEMITVSFDTSKVKVDEIHKAIAKAGHDTDKIKADDKTYDALPKCCHYERKLK